jgi:uncharacterized membrane-anchored protein YhcB (DUF1043 family)
MDKIKELANFYWNETAWRYRIISFVAGFILGWLLG